MNRLASIAGLTMPERMERRLVSLGMIAAVLAAMVALMLLYVGVRELTQQGVAKPAYDGALELGNVVPQAGSTGLMSVEDIRQLAEQD